MLQGARIPAGTAPNPPDTPRHQTRHRDPNRPLNRNGPPARTFFSSLLTRSGLIFEIKRVVILRNLRSAPGPI